MRRVVILGPGAAGKSTLAARLGRLTGLPVVELDALFWRPGLVPTPPDEWATAQRRLAAGQEWIMDGDLGPYDVLDVRLRAADTVILLDLSRLRCAWRALRRSHEPLDFWRWLWSYRRRYRPMVLRAIVTNAAAADLHVLRTPRAVEEFLADSPRNGRVRLP